MPDMRPRITTLLRPMGNTPRPRIGDTMLDIITQLLTDPGFAIGYLGEAINHIAEGAPQ